MLTTIGVNSGQIFSLTSLNVSV